MRRRVRKGYVYKENNQINKEGTIVEITEDDFQKFNWMFESVPEEVVEVKVVTEGMANNRMIDDSSVIKRGRSR